MALPGLAGTTAVPASSALIVRARAFRAWLEPLIPSLPRARLDTCLPARVSLLATTRAWLMAAGLDAAVLASWSCCRAVVARAGGPDPARGAAWSWAAPAWSSADQAGDRATAGPPVPLSRASPAASASRAACAPAWSPWPGPGPAGRTRSW